MNSELKKTVIIGSGNLAEALARAVAKSELELVQIFARNAERARIVAELAATGWETRPEMLRKDADIYLIAVSDRAVAEVAATLPIPEEAAVAHTAGSVPVTAIPERFARRAVFYPMQTFTRGREADFSVIPVFLEAPSPELRPELEAFARKLSGTVIWADSAQRCKVHLAAVFACNFANHMYAVGERIVRGAGLDFDVLKPLIAETAAKACDARSPLDVQTGPAVRNGDFIRRYNAKDGYALAYAIKIGYKVCIITGGRGRTLENRLRMLGIDHFYVDCMDKITAIREYMAGQGLDPANVIYMGDDIPDLDCMREVGLPVCPADAAAEVIEASRYVSEFRGGEGAVRDIVEQVLRARGDWARDSQGVTPSSLAASR